jgi:hypothetical protein
MTPLITQFSPLLVQNIYLNTLFLETFNLCSSLRLRSKMNVIPAFTYKILYATGNQRIAIRTL